MNELQLMQTIPTCECQSMSNGFATGVGIVAGIGLVGVIAGGIYYLVFKKR